MNKLSKWDPFVELSALQRRIFGDDWVVPMRGVSIPTTDVYTKDNELRVEAHLPHFEDKDVSVYIENNMLVISAERHEKEEDKHKKYVVRESSSSFYRRIALPDRADTDKIEARLHHGILKVSIPLTPLPEPKQIPLNTTKK